MMLNPDQFSFADHGSDVICGSRGLVDGSAAKPAHGFSAEVTGNIGGGATDDGLWSSYGFLLDSTPPSQCFQDLMAVDEADFDAIANATTEMSTALLSPKENTSVKAGDELSTEEVVRIAAAHFVQLSSPKERLPFGISLSSLTTEEVKNVELSTLLLAAAEKVANQQYERANNLLRQCYMSSSPTGNPVQRVAYYFSDALQVRMDRETGRASLKSREPEEDMTPEKVIKAMLASHALQLVCHKTLPCAQVLQFTSMQAIIEGVASAKRIHMIDLSIKHGLEWTILMQALATRHACPVECLKISAVGSAEEAVVPTGKRLSSFAENLGVPFEFRAVVVPDLKDLKETMFDLSEGEAVGVRSQMDMNAMIARPERLENVMRVIRRIRPCIMTVVDVEAKHNSPSFISRFSEALFYFSAWFDCFDSVMARGDGNRMELEGGFFSQGIRSIVAAEGEERVVRQVGVSVWREFFKRFGLVEIEVSEYSLYQASLVLNQFECGESCTLARDGKSLLVGWKGTPLHFVSAWKFQRERRM